MKIIIRRQPDYRNHQYCLLDFSGKFQGGNSQDDVRSMVHLGSLAKICEKQGAKIKYKMEMGAMELIGEEVENWGQKFLYTETTTLNEETRVVMVKGVVTKKILFNKRPNPNLEKGKGQNRSSGPYSLFRNK